jgi:Flp pilus assembly protein TadG
MRFIRSRRASRSEAGSALVEFAIVLPFILLLLLGAIEIGRFAYFSIVVANASRAGAQYGAQNIQTALDTTGISAAATADGTNAIAPLTTTSTTSCACWTGTVYSNIACTMPVTCASGNAVEFVSVTVSGTGHTIIGYKSLPSTLTVSATTKMRVVAQ